MAEVTAETLEAVHVRTARALLGFSTKELAVMIDGEQKTHDQIRNFESGRTSPRWVKEKIFDALIRCGIELQNGGKPGARVKNRARFDQATQG
ncbi:MAG: hypothetical protein AAFR51_07950 [Pseudomonadota bacterium]